MTCVEDPYGLLPDEDGDIVLGKLTSPKGLKGELRFLPGPNFWDGALGGEGLRIQGEESGEKRSIRVTRHTVSGRRHVLALEGVTERSQAEDLAGSEVFLDLGAGELQLPENPLPFQVLGKKVLLMDGSVLGILVDVLRLKPHDVYEVRGEEKTYQIPAIPEVIRDVDLEGGEIRIDPIPGLLDL